MYNEIIAICKFMRENKDHELTKQLKSMRYQEEILKLWRSKKAS